MTTAGLWNEWRDRKSFNEIIGSRVTWVTLSPMCPENNGKGYVIRISHSIMVMEAIAI